MAGKRLGIIPAAGKAVRFGGTLKELLPIGEDRVLLDYAAEAMTAGGADHILVVTSPRKIAAMADIRPNLLYTVQTESRDIWGAILAGLAIEADEYLFAMPDTIIPRMCFMEALKADFVMGCFETNMPQRFGMVRDYGIVNKQEGVPGLAWGVLMWTKAVRDTWLNCDRDITSYTHALNMAYNLFRWRTFELDFYADISNFEEYRRLIGEDRPV